MLANFWLFTKSEIMINSGKPLVTMHHRGWQAGIKSKPQKLQLISHDLINIKCGI